MFCDTFNKFFTFCTSIFDESVFKFSYSKEDALRFCSIIWYVVYSNTSGIISLVSNQWLFNLISSLGNGTKLQGAKLCNLSGWGTTGKFLIWNALKNEVSQGPLSLWNSQFPCPQSTDFYLRVVAKYSWTWNWLCGFVGRILCAQSPWHQRK